MATSQITASTISAKGFASFEGLRYSSNVKIQSFSYFKQNGQSFGSFHGLIVKGATTVAPKYTALKPLGDRVLVKTKIAEEKSVGGILLPTSAQSKPQGGEIGAVGEGRTVGKNKVDVSVKTGSQIVYSKYAGTEVEFNGTNHLIVKEDDIIGTLDTDDIKDLKPLNDRVLIKLWILELVAEAEEKTAGGLLLTGSSKEKPTIGMVRNLSDHLH
ncbi:chaperonin [Lithospermum erythrorhizon]|uniref:Chaperonin n=1 Tax=Lithospermum erythrorhizon TaxID=34254 RepID=A0AAV3R786_LITER